MKEKNENIEITCKIRGYFGKERFSIYMDEDNNLIDIDYTDFKPVEIVDKELRSILNTGFDIVIQRRYSDRVIESVLMDMYNNYAIFGFDSACPSKVIASLNAMVSWRLAEKVL